MKANGIVRDRAVCQAALLLVLAGACTESSPAEHGDAGSTGDGDGDGDSLHDAGTSPDDRPDGQVATSDGGTGEGDGDAQVPEGCGEGHVICGGSTPVCLDGACVECSSSDQSQCGQNEGCDLATHTCEASTPFALNCADLPSDGACHGGPREVLLATHDTGAIVMYDPADGTFLGYFKHSNVDFNSGDDYWYATQGPDQCIWTVNNGERGIERWNTDGKFKDNIIPVDTLFDENTPNEDLIQSPTHLAFSRDAVYVPSEYGYPHARLVRFGLDGKSPQVVLDDGSDVQSLIVMGDDSLVVSNDDGIWYLPAGGGDRVSVVKDIYPYQLTYAGAGDVLVATNGTGGTVFRANIYDQTATSVTANPQLNSLRGIAPLENGRWLVTAGDEDKIAIMDPASTPKGKHQSVFDDPALGYPYNFNYIGRACLSEEFVASRATPEPEASCDEPAGDVLFAENFENDDFTMEGDNATYHGFDVLAQTGVTVSLDTTQSVEGTGRSLKIAGGSGNLYDLPSGVHKELGSELKPSYISYYLRIDTTDFSGGHFALNDAPEESLDTLLVYNGNFRTFQSQGSATVEKDKWIHVQLRDFDWEEMTYDVYVDCKRVFDDMSFSPYGGTSLHALEMFNFTETAVSWFDNIVIK